MNRSITFRLLLTGIFLLNGVTARAADSIESRPLNFAKGTSSATVKGKLKGAQTIDYKLGARAGQSMTVTLKTSNSSNYFNVLPPGSNDVAIYNSSTGENTWTGTLPADGTYAVRLYLMRNAARRNELANYTLTVAITGASAHAAAASAAPAPATGAAATSPPAGTSASGTVPCAQARGQPTAPCPFEAMREAKGTAIVTVTLPDGRKRAIFFEKGKATGADVSQSEGKRPFKSSKQADLFMIQVGDERYEIPEAAAFGG